jgi:cytoskeletal protein RodZ
MTEALKKFAEELRTLRESKSISLNFIANRTKIDIKYLHAIENADFEALPEIYIRAFIKEYSQVIDLDEKETIKKFELAKKGIIEEKEKPTNQIEQKVPLEEIISTNESPVPLTESIDPPETISNEKLLEEPVKKSRMNIFVVGLSGIVIIFILVYFIFLRNTDDEIINQTTTEETNISNQNRFELENSAAEVNLVEDDSLKLSLSTSARVWVKVLSDNREVFQRIIDGTQNKSFKAKLEFRVVVGNAGLVDMQLNNKPLKLVGNRGEIRNYIIKKDTVISYLLSAPTRNEN